MTALGDEGVAGAKVDAEVEAEISEEAFEQLRILLTTRRWTRDRRL
ncbi:MAG: hypothetical protein AAGB48_12385 [Planctomycetota bacterium]